MFVDEFDVGVVFAFVADAEFVVLVDVAFIFVSVVVHDHAFVVGDAAFL